MAGVVISFFFLQDSMCNYVAVLLNVLPGVDVSDIERVKAQITYPKSNAI